MGVRHFILFVADDEFKMTTMMKKMLKMKTTFSSTSMNFSLAWTCYHLRKGTFVISIFDSLCGLFLWCLVFGIVRHLKDRCFTTTKTTETMKLCSVGVVFLSNVLLPYPTLVCHTKVMAKVCQFLIYIFFLLIGNKYCDIIALVFL